jgi:hypothetical protein
MSSHIISRKHSVPNFWKLILGLEIIVWIPIIFIGFDSHHDGLILTNVNLLKDSLQNNGDWPFNQYGPFWIIPYSLITYFLPSNLVYLALRVITVGLYFLTSYLIFLCAKTISTRRLAYISVLTFFFSQPFLTNYGTDLVPWPSAVVMPITALIFLFMIEIYKESLSKTNLAIKSVVIGMLLSAVLFSRVQIGLSLLVSIIFFMGFNRKFKSMYLIIIGFSALTLIILFFLMWRGWLNDALSDQYVFGSIYLRGDTSSYPFPIFTMIGTIVFLVLIAIGPILSKTLSKKNTFIPFAVISFCAVALIYLLFKDSRNLSMINTGVVILRRFWISYFLAIIIFSIFEQAKKSYVNFKENKIFDENLILRNCLVMISFISELQIFPLYDQMHFWWGSVPAVILVILISKERFFENNLVRQLNGKITNYLIIFFTILTIIPLTVHYNISYNKMPTNISKYIYVPQKQSLDEVKLQQFFNSNLVENSRILNLCSDANVFFNNGNYKSSSRIYVVWLSMSEVNTMYDSLSYSKPDFVVTCSLNRIPSLEKQGEAMQRKILLNSIENPILVASYAASPETIWRIYK